MRPQFQSLANELIDAFAPRGHVEFVSEFAEPYASRILCLLLGLPDEQWPQVAHWADDLGKSFGVNVRTDLPRIESALEGLTGYIEEVIAERLDESARRPRDDAAHRPRATTTHSAGASSASPSSSSPSPAWRRRATSSAWLCRRFCAPRPVGAAGERPELGAHAVEEVMRVNPTVTWVTREAIDDVDLFGLLVPKGGIVQVLSHAVGTDPRAMGAEPGFDIIVTDRPQHSGFGGGLHYCLGHFVARTDMSVALPLLAQPHARIDADGPGVWLPVSGNTGPVRLPMRFGRSDP